MLNRREFLKTAGALTAGTAAFGSAFASTPAKAGGHVVIVGGGYGGATAAKYLRMWSNGSVKVTLVERNAQFISCPISNLVIGGMKQLEDITVSYDNLRKRWGVDVITDEVVGLDPAKREIRLGGGKTLSYDRAVVSPGVDFMPERIEGLAGNEELVPHAWKAGPQTLLLRRQLEAMPDGGVYAMHIPTAPYRCPPGPYERACVIAHYFKQHKPRSKVMVFDGNPDIQSKKGLFMKAWEDHYKDIIEYHPNSRLMSVDAKARSAELEFGDIKADVLNVIPPMRAGRLADFLGVDLANERWVDVDFRTMEVKGAPGIHVLGDATLSAPVMPKSGHMANQHAKVAAAAIIEMLAGREPNPSPLVMNTCYSFVDDKNVVHVASVHQWSIEQKTFLAVPGSGGVSAVASELEGHHAMAWAKNIWADMLA